MQIFEEASFSSYVQQYNRKQLNQLILCPFDARRLAGGQPFARFVLFRLIKKRSFNLLGVLGLFSDRWQSTLFQIFFSSSSSNLAPLLIWKTAWSDVSAL